MSLDLETLQAYADGELSPQRRAEVEAVLATDVDLAAAAAAMFASRLPYRSAFEHEALPAVPAELAARVADLSAVTAASREFAFSHDGPTPTRRDRRGLTQWWPALLALMIGVLAGYAISSAIAAAQQRQIEPWLRSAIAYHAMYSRETVTDGGAEPSRPQFDALRGALREQHGLELAVPDLRSQGLQFVRAQRLQFDGRTVLQIVYLPAQGAPVALCLMQSPGQAKREISLDGQQAQTWHADGWAHVLIGSLPDAQMRSIRRQIPASTLKAAARG